MLLILIYTLGFLTLLIVTIIYLKLIRPERHLYDRLRAQGIKGELFIPLFGQIFQMLRYRKSDSLLRFYEDLAKKHGNTFLFSFGPALRLVISDPDLIADILSRNNAQNYTKPPVAVVLAEPLIGKHNILICEGDEHERARRMINPAFYHTNLKSLISIITDRTTKTIDSILQSKSDSDQINLQVLFNKLTLSIIVSSAFGADFETNANTKEVMGRVLNEVLQTSMYRSLLMINQIPFLAKLPFWKKNTLDEGGRIIAQFVDQIIIDRREGRSRSMSNGPDLLDLLLSAVDDQGISFTDQEIKDEALTFVFAGSETTGNLLVWLFYVLMTHENILKACQEEIDRVLPNNTELTYEHLADLVICEAIIHETLRLYPPAPFFPRYCINEHTIGNEQQIRVPVGTCINIHTYLLHRRADLWPRPLEFDYTRWLRDPKSGLKPKLTHPFAYLPFAAGPRNCIGQNFALLEAKIILALVVQRCQLQLSPGQKVIEDIQITLKTKYGLWANLTPRQK